MLAESAPFNSFPRPITRGLRVETATIYERGGQYPGPPEPPPRLFRKCVTERDLGNFFSVNPCLCSLGAWQRSADRDRRDYLVTI